MAWIRSHIRSSLALFLTTVLLGSKTAFSSSRVVAENGASLKKSSESIQQRRMDEDDAVVVEFWSDVRGDWDETRQAPGPNIEMVPVLSAMRPFENDTLVDFFPQMYIPFDDNAPCYPATNVAAENTVGCAQSCTNGGRYCLFNQGTIPGKAIITEAVRRMCIWDSFAEEEPQKYLDYLVLFGMQKCYQTLSSGSSEEDNQCLSLVLKEIEIDADVLADCADQYGGLEEDKMNFLLQGTLEEMDGLSDYGVTSVPVLLVNGEVVTQVDTPTVTAAICDAYPAEEDEKPQECLKEEQVEDAGSLATTNGVTETTIDQTLQGSTTIPVGGEVAGDPSSVGAAGAIDPVGGVGAADGLNAGVAVNAVDASNGINADPGIAAPGSFDPTANAVNPVNADPGIVVPGAVDATNAVDPNSVNANPAIAVPGAVDTTNAAALDPNNINPSNAAVDPNSLGANPAVIPPGSVDPANAVDPSNGVNPGVVVPGVVDPTTGAIDPNNVNANPGVLAPGSVDPNGVNANPGVPAAGSVDPTNAIDPATANVIPGTVDTTTAVAPNAIPGTVDTTVDPNSINANPGSVIPGSTVAGTTNEVDPNSINANAGSVVPGITDPNAGVVPTGINDPTKAVDPNSVIPGTVDGTTQVAVPADKEQDADQEQDADKGVVVEFWSAVLNDWDFEQNSQGPNYELIPTAGAILKYFMQEPTFTFVPQIAIPLKQTSCHMENFPETQECGEMCTNWGNYCMVAPEGSDVMGKNLLIESARRLCIWELYGEDEPQKYLDYLLMIALQSCAKTLDEACINTAATQSGVDPALISQCIDGNGGLELDQSNVLIEASVLEFGALQSQGVTSFPTILVNGVIVDDTTSSGVRAAVCDAYGAYGMEIEQPPVCSSDFVDDDALEDDDISSLILGSDNSTWGPPLDQSEDGIVIPDTFPPITIGNELQADASDFLLEMFGNILKNEHVKEECGANLGPVFTVGTEFRKIFNGTSTFTFEALEEIFDYGEACSFLEEAHMKKAFGKFRNCIGGGDLSKLLNLLPSIVVSDAMKCVDAMVALSALHPKYAPVEGIPEECIATVLGDNMLGKFLRGLYLEPVEMTSCLEKFQEDLPNCTADYDVIPIDGGALQTAGCILGKVGDMTSSFCETELRTLELCMPVIGERIMCDQVMERCAILGAFMSTLPYPFLGAPLPGACVSQMGVEGDYGDLLERYDAFSNKCGDRKVIWEFNSKNVLDEIEGGSDSLFDVLSGLDETADLITGVASDYALVKYDLQLEPTTATFMSGTVIGITIGLSVWLFMSFMRTLCWCCCGKRSEPDTQYGTLPTDEFEDEPNDRVV